MTPHETQEAKEGQALEQSQGTPRLLPMAGITAAIVAVFAHLGGGAALVHLGLGAAVTYLGVNLGTFSVGALVLQVALVAITLAYIYRMHRWRQHRR